MDSFEGTLQSLGYDVENVDNESNIEQNQIKDIEEGLFNDKQSQNTKKNMDKISFSKKITEDNIGAQTDNVVQNETKVPYESSDKIENHVVNETDFQTETTDQSENNVQIETNVQIESSDERKTMIPEQTIRRHSDDDFVDKLSQLENELVKFTGENITVNDAYEDNSSEPMEHDALVDDISNSEGNAAVSSQYTEETTSSTEGQIRASSQYSAETMDHENMSEDTNTETRLNDNGKGSSKGSNVMDPKGLMQDDFGAGVNNIISSAQCTPMEHISDKGSDGDGEETNQNKEKGHIMDCAKIAGELIASI
jgi:hypothetical protein